MDPGSAPLVQVVSREPRTPCAIRSVLKNEPLGAIACRMTSGSRPRRSGTAERRPPRACGRAASRLVAVLAVADRPAGHALDIPRSTSRRARSGWARRSAPPSCRSCPRPRGAWSACSATRRLPATEEPGQGLEVVVLEEDHLHPTAERVARPVTMRAIRSLPGSSCGWALPAQTIWIGRRPRIASRRSRSERSRSVRLYGVARRAQPDGERLGVEPTAGAGRHLVEQAARLRLGVSPAHLVERDAAGVAQAARCLAAIDGMCRSKRRRERRCGPRRGVDAVGDRVDRRIAGNMLSDTCRGAAPRR